MNYLNKTSLINIGSGNEYSIKQFASKIIKIVGIKSKLKFNKKFPDGTLRKVLDTKFINKLGWKSNITINRGLKHTIDWYINEYK